VEHAFLLQLVSSTIHVTGLCGAYNWDPAGHGVESQGGEGHDDDDNPGGVLLATQEGEPPEAAYHSVRLPTSPAVSYTGGTPGMTVGIGATEEEAFASISGWTIILDNVSMKSDECMAPTKSRRDETRQ
jgi:hypothetical protein